MYIYYIYKGGCISSLPYHYIVFLMPFYFSSDPSIHAIKQIQTMTSSGAGLPRKAY